MQGAGTVIPSRKQDLTQDVGHSGARVLPRGKMRFGLLFASPAFIFFGLFYLYPLFRTFYVSLY